MPEQSRRGVGEAEFAFATLALESTGQLRVLRYAICALCMSMVILGVIVQVHPLGPEGLLARSVHGAVMASAAVVGAWWFLRPWPGYRAAIAFVAWADVSVVVAAALTTGSPARLCATIHMGLVGVFIAFLLGWRILAAHCAFAGVVIAGFTVWGVQTEDVGVFDLYIYFAPALSSVVVLPLVIQAILETARRSIRATAVHARLDPLTRLLNRRGMYSAVDERLAETPTPPLIGVAVIDVDRFKLLNDRGGHSLGDAALRSVADRLRTAIGPTDVAARLGGDEFVAVVFPADRDELDTFVSGCSVLRSFDLDGIGISTSIGIAWTPTTDRRLRLDELLHRADAAMYDAKERGGEVSVVDFA
ncbi:GGDEF domain-containing protein [Rhodococcus sp. 14-2483-1-2]|uniref:GGDEF domain-containing protein n=1 Tax=Rhodococcus sp. 14-2483-1-2 TaxID=2023147 RepID=UPI000B9C649C|nr:GGDEF domain-containing protein [Rhodococcus sp. 14-2483-1-2]OZF33538.1 hypothetical protein CH295_11180 [Rhodococcus sp. 14-2483-1-2]